MLPMKRVRCLIISYGLAAILSACGASGEGPELSSSSVEPHEKFAPTSEFDNRDIEAPRQPAGAKLTAFPPTATWNDYLATLPRYERKLLESANQRYFGLLEFNSPQEYATLIQAGFPSPEEWLNFESMTDYELRKRAQANERMAQLFYADRLAQRAGRAPGELGGRTPEVERIAIDATIQAAIALRGSRDPFSAYVYGKVSSIQLGMPEAMAAAIMVAMDRGDSRAQQVLHLFNNDHSHLRTDVVHTLYRGMKRDSGS